MLELQIPIDVVEADLDSDDPRRRAAAARAFPDRSAEVQERLLGDPDPYVVDEAAANPRLKPSCMDQLLDQLEAQVLECPPGRRWIGYGRRWLTGAR